TCFFKPREFVFDYLPFLITHITGVFFIHTMILAQYSYFCLVFRHPLRQARYGVFAGMTLKLLVPFFSISGGIAAA
ncbi:MAG: hypothetical protein VCF25_33170, partial [Candidatus Poribacteria bacterium]